MGKTRRLPASPLSHRSSSRRALDRMIPERYSPRQITGINWDRTSGRTFSSSMSPSAIGSKTPSRFGDTDLRIDKLHDDTPVKLTKPFQVKRIAPTKLLDYFTV